MAIYAYTKEVHDFVREHCTKMRDAELAEACNKAFGTEFTQSKMKAFRANHGYKNGLGKLTHEEVMARNYPPGMFEYVRDNSWGVSSKEMAERVNEKFGTNFSRTGMKQFRQRHGIKSGVTGWYQKGHEPGTKGKTIEEICKNDPEKIARVRATCFRKGHRPVNEMPVGTVRAASWTGYYNYIKLSSDGSQFERWVPLHRHIWEQANGPIPEGACIIFLDGNRQNCELENLAMVTRGELVMMVKSGYFSDCPEATDAGIKLVRIRRKVKEREKEKNADRADGGDV
jgi:hypothetical protein